MIKSISGSYITYSWCVIVRIELYHSAKLITSGRQFATPNGGKSLGSIHALDMVLNMFSLCLGTNQVSSSKPLEGLYDILNPRVFSESASMEDIQGFRLYLVARLIAVTSQGLSTALTDSKTFASDLEGLVAVYSATKNCLLPLLGALFNRYHLFRVLI